MEAIIKFFGKLLYKLCYFIGKYVCKAIAVIAKFVWKTSKSLYEQYKEKKAASEANGNASAGDPQDIAGVCESSSPAEDVVTEAKGE